MTTEKQMCSFVDLMNDLRCKYDDLLDRNVYLLSELEGFNPVPERLIVREWSQGLSPLIALNVPGYLDTLRLPCEILETLFHTMPRTLKDVPQEERWMQICLALTPPFQTQELDRLRDMRPAYKHREGGGWRGRDERRNRHVLIAVLAHALCDYEAAVQRDRSIWHQRVTEMQEGIEGNNTAQLLFERLRKQERLPAALKGKRTKQVAAACTLMNTILQVFVSKSDELIPIWFQSRIRRHYNRLLFGMNLSFELCGPDRYYPAEARYHALSAILSSLLRISALPLNADCTTPDAIQRRLSRRKFA